MRRKKNLGNSTQNWNVTTPVIELALRFATRRNLNPINYSITCILMPGVVLIPCCKLLENRYFPHSQPNFLLSSEEEELIKCKCSKLPRRDTPIIKDKSSIKDRNFGARSDTEVAGHKRPKLGECFAQDKKVASRLSFLWPIILAMWSFREKKALKGKSGKWSVSFRRYIFCSECIERESRKNVW